MKLMHKYYFLMFKGDACGDASHANPKGSARSPIVVTNKWSPKLIRHWHIRDFVSSSNGSQNKNAPNFTAKSEKSLYKYKPMKRVTLNLTIKRNRFILHL